MAHTPTDFAKMVPGFDFLQGLTRNAGSVLPNIGQWVAPTLDPAELEKRIEELRTVQFWLEQNARMLAATIQALEVQRMTLSTLKTMNVQMADLQESMRIKLPEATPIARPSMAPMAAPAPTKAKPVTRPKRGESPAEKPAKASGPAAAVVDPMQWWGALTKQFTELATHAMKDASVETAKAPGATAQPVQNAAVAAGKGGPAAGGAKTARKASSPATPRGPTARRG